MAYRIGFDLGGFVANALDPLQLVHSAPGGRSLTNLADPGQVFHSGKPATSPAGRGGASGGMPHQSHALGTTNPGAGVWQGGQYAQPPQQPQAPYQDPYGGYPPPQYPDPSQQYGGYPPPQYGYPPPQQPYYPPQQPQYGYAQTPYGYQDPYSMPYGYGL